MEIKKLNQNEIIFRQGAVEDCMYSVAAGSVGIYLNYGEEQETQLAKLAAGQFFGEMGLFENLPRSATAVALEDGTELEMISKGSITQGFIGKPELLINIMRTMSGRIRALTGDYMEACRAIAEAAEAAKKGSEKSSGLKAKLGKFVNDYIKPCFLSPSMDYDITAYMCSSAQASADSRVFNAKAVIFREGDASSCMYDLRRGSIGIYADYGKSSEKLLAELKEDAFFGEMGIIDEAPRSATAVALENNTELEVISAENFSAYLQKKPMKALMILQHMSGRLRALTEDYMEACRLVANGVETEAKEGNQRSWLSPEFEKYIAEYNSVMSQYPFNMYYYH